MALLALELNDAGIRAVKDTEPGLEAFPPSPGVALWDGATLLTGREAARRARLRPRWSHDRFWQAPDTTPLAAPFPPHFRSADLLHAHLLEIWNTVNSDVDEVLLAIPGTYSTTEMGLILGVARACQIPVRGLVDQGLAASLLARDGDELIHLDLHLHRAVATEVTRTHHLERMEIAVDEELGLSRFWDRWVKFLSETFVRSTRFDPLHSGETEQALYQRLPTWLDALRQQDSAVISMRSADKEYSIEMAREQMIAAAAPLLERLGRLARSLQRAHERTNLLVTPWVSDLPGAMDRLRESDLNVISLPSAAGAMGAVRMKEAIRKASQAEKTGPALPFLTRLTLDAAPAAEAPPRGKSGAPPSLPRGKTLPTHVLCNGVAHVITPQPLTLGLLPDGANGIDVSASPEKTAGISRSHCTIYARNGRVVVEDHSRYGTFLNDQRVEGKATLVAGDRLRLGTPGIELRLIQVASSHGKTTD